MFSRRYIRGFCLALLLLCLSGWVWSAWGFATIAYAHAGYFVQCSTVSGTVNIGLAREHSNHGWFGQVAFPKDASFWPHLRPNRGTLFCHGGFRVCHDTTPWWDSGGTRHTMEFWTLHVPYWFLVLVCSGLLILAWRKTRPKPAAFPVEIRGTPLTN